MSTGRHSAEADTTPEGDPASGAYPAASTPFAPPAASWAGALIAVALLAAGVVALRDTAISLGWIDGRKWVDSCIDWIDGLRFEPWMIPVGIASVLLGAWMAVSAVRPRRRTALAMATHSAVWIRPADVARSASAAAMTIPGVLEAHTTARPRKLTVRATVTDSRDPAMVGLIEDAVAPVVDTLQRRPKLVVRVRTGGR